MSHTMHGFQHGRSRRDNVLQPGASRNFDYGLDSGFVSPGTPPHLNHSPYLPILTNHTPVMAPVVPPLSSPVDRHRDPWADPAAGDAPEWPTPTFIRDPTEVQYRATQHSYPNPLWERGTHLPEPFGTSSPLRIHPHIILNPNNPNVPQLQWDIIHRPDLATRLTGHGRTVPVDLDQPAVDPSVNTVWLATDHPTLVAWMQRWGPIRIDKPNITIRDILDAIYNYLQPPMTPEDVEFAIATPQNSQNLIIAAHQRIQDFCDLYAVGVFKRVDVMGGHRRFQGLRVVGCQGDTWKLCLGLLPGPVPHVR